MRNMMKDDAQAVSAVEGHRSGTGLSAAAADGGDGLDNSEATHVGTASAATPVRNPGVASALVFVDVPIKVSGVGGAVKVVLGWLVWLAAVLAVIVVMELGLRAAGINAPILVRIVAVFILPALIVGAIPWLQRRRERRRVTRLVASRVGSADLRPLADAVIRKRKWWSGTSGIEALVTALATLRGPNVTLRLCRPGDAFVVRPTEVDFEFRPLAENDPSFVELRAATAPSSDQDVRLSEGGNLLHTMWRNVHLKQGRVALFIIVLFLAWAVWRSYQGGRVQAGVFIWSVVLLCKLFWPVTTSMGTMAWFLVPGGLAVNLGVMARAYRADGVIRLTPGDSVLAVYQANRYKWKCFVAQSGLPPLGRVATRAEVEMLLSAWTSPVQPPSEELLNSVISPR